MLFLFFLFLLLTIDWFWFSGEWNAVGQTLLLLPWTEEGGEEQSQNHDRPERQYQRPSDTQSRCELRRSL